MLLSLAGNTLFEHLILKEKFDMRVSHHLIFSYFEVQNWYLCVRFIDFLYFWLCLLLITCSHDVMNLPTRGDRGCKESARCQGIKGAQWALKLWHWSHGVGDMALEVGDRCIDNNEYQSPRCVKKLGWSPKLGETLSSIRISKRGRWEYIVHHQTIWTNSVNHK